MIFIELKGQVRGGKNNMKIGRNGRHYPDPSFEKWRNAACREIRNQLESDFKTIDSIDYEWIFLYTPEDRRRRDVPAILDAVFHCLEKTEVVKDDCLIKNIVFVNGEPKKEAAGMLIKIKKIDTIPRA